ncbi:MAG: hypothetical protein HOP32_06960 [Nitrospira sp.]|nr:hypothetical protein [Nitrospira sp.]
MPKKKGEDLETGAWMLRDVPRDLMERMRISAAVQRTTVKALLLQLAENHLAEMEKKGQIPKSRS